MRRWIVMGTKAYGTTSVAHLRAAPVQKRGSFYYFSVKVRGLPAAALEGGMVQDEQGEQDALFSQQFHRSSGSIATSNLCTNVWPNFKKEGVPASAAPLKHRERGEHRKTR